MPNETFLSYLRSRRCGPVTTGLGCVYAVAWIFSLIACRGGEERPISPFTYPVSVGSRAGTHTEYFRPWIGWWLEHAAYILPAFIPLFLVTYWLDWRRDRAA